MKSSDPGQRRADRAPRPFEKSIQALSKEAQTDEGASPVATVRVDSRAPSRWLTSRCSATTSMTALISSARQMVPPARFGGLLDPCQAWTWAYRVGGERASVRLLGRVDASLAVDGPRLSTGEGSRPARLGMERMRGSVAVGTRRQGGSEGERDLVAHRARSRKTAVFLPSSSATVSVKALTLGSSPFASSELHRRLPTWRDAMGRRWGGSPIVKRSTCTRQGDG